MIRRPAVEVKVGRIGQGGDPIFEVGSTHRATIVLTNPTAWDWAYFVLLDCFAPPAFAPVTWEIPIAAEATVTLEADITMGATEMTSGQVMVEVREVSTGEVFTFYFDTITLQVVAVPAVMATLTWD